MGDYVDVLHPLFILSYPVIVDNIHLKAYWESIHLLVIFLPYFAMVR